MSTKKTNKTTDPEELKRTFRFLTRKQKFAELTKLANSFGRIPRRYKTKTYTPDVYEILCGNFYANMKSSMNRGELSKSDVRLLLAFEEKFLVKRPPKDQLVDIVYEFCQKNKRLPEPRMSDDDQTIAAWRMLRLPAVKEETVSPSHVAKMRRINRLLALKQHNRTHRLKQLLRFCVQNERTPRQHSLDIDEKRLADFLSTTKQRNKKHPLSRVDKKLFTEILTYAPPKKNVV